MVFPAVRHMVVHCRVGVWEWISVGIWRNVVGMDGLLQLSCSAGTQQPGFSTLEDGHLLDGRFFIGASIESLDTWMFELTLIQG